jgi:serine/threonine-protein kinase HipA
MRAGGSAGGMRPKFLVHFSPTNQSISYGLPLLDESSGVPAIIKVPLRHSEEYQQIEYVYSQMARLCGITIPRTWLLCSHEHHYFLIERFDCTARGERVHLHSAAGLMGVNFEEIAGEYRELLSLTATLTRDQVQVDELYKRMLFNALGYNCDDHYKNVSFVMDHAGSWRLSPAYDVCYSRGRNGVHATRLNNKIDGFDKKDFARIAQEAGVKSWETMVAEVVEALSAWRELAAQAHISSQRSAQIQQLIEKAISSV